MLSPTGRFIQEVSLHCVFITSSCCWVGSLGVRCFCQRVDWQKGFYWWFVSTFKGALLWSSNSKNSVPGNRSREEPQESTGGQDNIPHAVVNLMLIERIVNILDGWWTSCTVLQYNMPGYKEDNWVSVAVALSQRRLLVRRRLWEHRVLGLEWLHPVSSHWRTCWRPPEGCGAHKWGERPWGGHVKMTRWFFTVYKFHPVVTQLCNCYVLICRWFANIHVKVQRDQKHFLIYSWSLSGKRGAALKH